ncbi:hypothetical protein VNO78_08998 [Psophocarpus tetragonolobus]|uniref:non-specific serine/threonine protein kinase n=1 Tax=Psophocarpus tetragonolobus TaxID=3891 RepID=A0AAN9SYT9_PSOTE
MANTNDTSSSSSNSDKDSAPSPSSSSSSSSDEAESPKATPSKSPPPPLPLPSPSPSPPLPSPSPPPPEQSSPPPKESPPPPKESPPPPKESPPPSPPRKESPPPPAPPRSPPPSPPRTPPPAKPPPSLSPSPPPPSSPPPSKGSVPAPSPSKPPPSPALTSPPPPQNSPPLPQPHPPPPHSLSPPTAIPTPPPPASHVTPMPAPVGSGPRPLPPPPSPPVSPPNKPTIALPKSNPPPTPPSSGGGNNTNTGEIIGVALAGVLIIALLALVIFFLFRRKQKRSEVYVLPPTRKSHMKGGDVHYYVEEPGFGSGAQGGMPIGSPAEPAQHMSTGQLVFTYEKIAEITNGFSSENIIGEGGFGYVYKASMPDGRVGALKMLKAGSGQGEREFRAEVDIISRIHHRHLVSLIGYCISEQQRVLIYEFVPNGNLNQHLHGSEWPILDWSKRMKTAIGAARGLAYLHDGCNPKIIHRDIKSANILLDNDYEAQVADFGLARLTDDANTHVSTRVMGTFGYMAPEYATSGKLTDRSDVFSFGVVLLELITGRKPVDTMQPIGEESLVEWARPLLLRAIETGDFSKLVDPRLEGQYVDTEMFKMIEAAAACVRHSAPKRPRMVQVARALDTGNQLYDLSNGVKYGQSTVYDSGQYNEDITRFRRMVNGSFDDSDFDMYSSDYRSAVSREQSTSKHSRFANSTGSDSEFRVFHSQRSNAHNMS